jgi:hypothetical protein
MLVVYMGQDTEFANAAPLEVEIDTNLNLEDFTAKIDFFGITKNFDSDVVRTKKLPLSYTAEETKAFFPGLNYADLYLFDPDGRQAIYRKIIIAVKLSGDRAVDYIEADRAAAILAKLKEVAAGLPELIEEDDTAKIKTICNEMMSALRFNGEFEAKDSCKCMDGSIEKMVEKIRRLEELAQSATILDEDSTTAEIKQLLNEFIVTFTK